MFLAGSGVGLLYVTGFHSANALFGTAQRPATFRFNASHVSFINLLLAFSF
jgi:hypothetical protein